MSQLGNEPNEMEDDAKSSHSTYSAQSAPNPHHKKERIKGKKHLKVREDHTNETETHSNDNVTDLTLTDSVSYDETIARDKKVKKKKFKTAEGAYSQLSKQERREFRMAFRLFDKDDDGQISVYELKKVFDGLNYHFTETQLINMLKSIDDNGDGKVDIDEFVCVMKGSAYSETSNTRPYVDELREAFEVFDKDGDGQIQPQELAAIMKALGENLNEQDILTMIQEADADGDGNIDFEEFKKLMEGDTILGWDHLNANSGSSNSKSLEDAKLQNENNNSH
eukprot:UN00030